EITKEYIEKNEGICTLTNNHKYIRDNKTGQEKRTIIGNNGFDGIGSIKIEGDVIKFIVQCKTSQMHNDISALQGVLTRYPDHIGLMIVANNSLNVAARNIAKQSEQTILVIEISELKNLKDILSKTKIATKSIIEYHTEETIIKGYKKYNNHGILVEEAREKRQVKIIQKKHTKGASCLDPYKRTQISRKRVVSKENN
ncbi:5270_t:CDS:1, partial [Funneliformis geosporum]